MKISARNASAPSKRQGGWGLPGLVALAGGAAMVALASAVRVPESSGGAAGLDDGDAVPALVVTRLDWLPAGSEAKERLRLLDPTPLFMPDRKEGGAGPAGEGVAERPGGSVTESAPAILVFADSRPARDVLRRPLPASPFEAAERVASPRWFDGLARADHGLNGENDPLLARARAAGRMDVFSQGIAGPMARVELPRDPALEAEIWQPVELNVLINAAGAVMSPVITSGSGIGEVDERVRTIVKQELLPRLRLRPGAYRLVVGP